ncbi:SURF1 family cytochrome oxidase biogenesis protein [Pseudoclavibacter endophyticus]|nr:SURF1 family cytochrome oxidase biogenesis protein [Pseudoclavibacter endophyticus]
MTRPKWLAMLVLVFAVAAAFAGLAQWQIDQAVRSAQQASQPALGPTTLGVAATPQEGLFDSSVGRTVSFEGVVDPRDIDIVTDRLQGTDLGYWVIGHVYVTDDGVTDWDGRPRSGHAPSLAVAFGWAATLDEAQRSADELRASISPAADAEPAEFQGRLEYGQAPSPPAAGDDPHTIGQMAPAYLLNRWAEPGPLAYGSYVVLDLGEADRAGLEPITVVTAAQDGTSLNMLNVFYAIEWVVFALFAFYVWWRLVRAEYERERETALAMRNPDERVEEEVRMRVLRRLRDERAGGTGGAGSGR